MKITALFGNGTLHLIIIIHSDGIHRIETFNLSYPSPSPKQTTPNPINSSPVLLINTKSSNKSKH